MTKHFYWFVSLFILTVQTAIAQESNTGTEIIYGRKDGMALTMIKLDPEKSNGKAVIWTVSGNWVSSLSQVPGREKMKMLLDRGYTVFQVMHGSQPKYNIEDALTDMQRAVRFIRHNAAVFKIDPAHIGISGGSAGGHLSLLLALMDGKGDEKATDPVNRESAKVQAAAVFYPPTNFTNWNGLTDVAMITTMLPLRGLAGAFDFRSWDSTRMYYKSITDKDQLFQRLKSTSPVTHVSPDDAPVFIYHGDADRVVPISQSHDLLSKLTEAKVPNDFKVKPGADHGWTGMWSELTLFADWFDKYLK